MTKKKDPKDLLKVGRPSMYTEELALKICKAIATSTDSLRKICDRNVDFPCKDTVNEWRFDYPKFSGLYTLAKQQQAELLAEEILDISDYTALDSKINFKTGEETLDTEWVARSRLRVDSRKWLACKLVPKVYGDRSTNESTVTIINPADALKELK